MLDLYDLTFTKASAPHWRHELLFILRHVNPLRAISHVISGIIKSFTAALLDTLDGSQRKCDPIIRQELGVTPEGESRSVAIFVHYHPSGIVSQMVLEQVKGYRRFGFVVVLVSNSPVFPEPSWQEARRVAALVVHRRNHGLDFGAWKDLVSSALKRWPEADELLLANDSVLGPIRPLEPMFAAMRAGGPGFYGLLESIQGGSHLQSWFMLARGRKAIEDVAHFLANLRLSRSKPLTIQRSELQLSRTMHARGHRVAAIYGYAPLIELALREPAEREYLKRAVPTWFAGGNEKVITRRFLNLPLNPAHHLWRLLVGRAGFPFIKTELVRRNPGRLPDVQSWAALVPSDAPCQVRVLETHLAMMGP